MLVDSIIAEHTAAFDDISARRKPIDNVITSTNGRVNILAKAHGVLAALNNSFLEVL